MSQGDQNHTEFRWTMCLRWLLATTGLNSVPPKRLEFPFKARKRKGYLEQLECMSRGEGGYHIKCGGLYQVLWTPGLRWRLHLGLPVTPQTEVDEAPDCTSDLCGQFYKVHHKSPHSLPFTPKALSVQRYSQRKRAHQDCPSDSEKIPHGDTLG